MTITRRRVLTMAGAAGLGVGLYSTLWEPHWLEIVRLDLPVRHLPASLLGRPLVQLSDIHVGPRVSDAYVLETFRTVEALAPDVIAYTGDFVSVEDDAIYAHAARIYDAAPHGRIATVGVTGNHEYGWDWAHPDIAARLAGIFDARGIRMLRNQVADVDGLQIVGLDDLWASRFDATAALAGVDPGRAAIALSHNPDTADLSGWGTFRGWILSGHTHGGQCKPPFLPPPIVPVKNRRYTSGVFDAPGGRTLYVNRGIGHLYECRFNVRPELTVFTLQRA